MLPQTLGQPVGMTMSLRGAKASRIEPLGKAVVLLSVEAEDQEVSTRHESVSPPLVLSALPELSGSIGTPSGPSTASSSENPATPAFKKQGFPPRRVSNALTAREIIYLAAEPSLVPKPLSFRKLGQNISVPAALETSRSVEQRLEVLDGVVENAKLPAEFRVLARSNRHGILDVLARFVAAGADPSDFADDMGIDLSELTQHIASFGVAARDSPEDVEEEVHAFNAPFSTSTEHAGTLEDTCTLEDEITSVSKQVEEWGQTWEEEDTLVEEGPDEVAESTWRDKRKDTRDGDIQSNLQKDEDRFSAYHDALEAQNYAENSFIQGVTERCESQIPSFPQQATNVPHARLPSAIVPTSTDPAAAHPASVQVHGSGTRQPSSPLLVKVISKIPFVFLLILAVIIGRSLGVLLSEIQAVVYSYGSWAMQVLFDSARPIAVEHVVSKYVIVRV